MQDASYSPLLHSVRSVFVHAEGGLALDARHRVLGADGAPVPGRFAAGSIGQGGLLLKGHGHHLGRAFVSGRRAGRYAALERLLTTSMNGAAER